MVHDTPLIINRVRTAAGGDQTNPSRSAPVD